MEDQNPGQKRKREDSEPGQVPRAKRARLTAADALIAAPVPQSLELSRPVAVRVRLVQHESPSTVALDVRAELEFEPLGSLYVSGTLQVCAGMPGNYEVPRGLADDAFVSVTGHNSQGPPAPPIPFDGAPVHLDRMGATVTVRSGSHIEQTIVVPMRTLSLQALGHPFAVLADAAVEACSACDLVGFARLIGQVWRSAPTEETLQDVMRRCLAAIPPVLEADAISIDRLLAHAILPKLLRSDSLESLRQIRRAQAMLLGRSARVAVIDSRIADRLAEHALFCQQHNYAEAELSNMMAILAMRSMEGHQLQADQPDALAVLLTAVQVTLLAGRAGQARAYLDLTRPVGQAAEGGAREIEVRDRLRADLDQPAGSAVRIRFRESGNEVRVRILGTLPVTTLRQAELARAEAALRGCEHPSVVALIHATIEVGREPTLVFGSPAGGTLGSLIRSGAGDAHARLRVLSGAATGLVWLLSRAVVHGDVSPDTMFIASDGSGLIGEPVLSVLGVSVLDPTVIAGAQADMLRRGYAAPEIAAGPHVSSESDVYSWGMSALVALTSRAPVEDADDRQTGLRVRVAEGRGMEIDLADDRVAGWFPALAEAVVELGLACTHHDAAHRPSVAVARDRLERAMLQVNL